MSNSNKPPKRSSIASLPNSFKGANNSVNATPKKTQGRDTEEVHPGDQNGKRGTTTVPSKSTKLGVEGSLPNSLEGGGKNAPEEGTERDLSLDGQTDLFAPLDEVIRGEVNLQEGVDKGTPIVGEPSADLNSDKEHKGTNKEGSNSTQKGVDKFSNRDMEGTTKGTDKETLEGTTKGTLEGTNKGTLEGTQRVQKRDTASEIKDREFEAEAQRVSAASLERQSKAYELEMKLQNIDHKQKCNLQIWCTPVLSEVLNFLSEELGAPAGEVALSAVVMFYKNAFSTERKSLTDMGFLLDNLSLQNQELCFETSALEDLAQQAMELEASPYFSQEDELFPEDYVEEGSDDNGTEGSSNEEENN